MRDFLYYIFSIAGSKLLPVFYSFILVNQHNNSDYIYFLNCFLYANLLSTTSTIGYSTIILNSNDTLMDENAYKAYTFSVLVSLVGAVFAYFFIESNSSSIITIIVSIALYSLGISISSIIATQLNAQLKNKASALTVGLTITIPYISGILLIIFSTLKASTVFLIISIFLFMVSLFFLKRNNYFRIKPAKALSTVKESFPINHESINFVILALGILFSNNILFSFLSKNFTSEQALIYGIGYQAFGLGIFIPNIMTNYLIPNATNKKKFDIIKVIKYYIGISTIWFISLLLITPYIFNAYNIKVNPEGYFIFMILQFTVIISSINIAMNQYISYKKQYQHLGLSGVVFLVSTLACIYLFKHSILLISCSLLIGYILTTSSITLNHKYGFYKSCKKS